MATNMGGIKNDVDYHKRINNRYWNQVIHDDLPLPWLCFVPVLILPCALRDDRGRVIHLTKDPRKIVNDQPRINVFVIGHRFDPPWKAHDEGVHASGTPFLQGLPVFAFWDISSKGSVGLDSPCWLQGLPPTHELLPIMARLNGWHRGLLFALDPALHLFRTRRCRQVLWIKMYMLFKRCQASKCETYPTRWSGFLECDQGCHQVLPNTLCWSSS